MIYDLYGLAELEQRISLRAAPYSPGEETPPTG